MNKNLQAFSVIFLGVCIVISSWFISKALDTNQSEGLETQVQQVEEQNRYEFIEIAGNHKMIFDKQTGNYWSNIDGQGWEKNTPISNQEN